MLCVNCGHSCNDNANFCPICGHTFQSYYPSQPSAYYPQPDTSVQNDVTQPIVSPPKVISKKTKIIIGICSGLVVIALIVLFCVILTSAALNADTPEGVWICGRMIYRFNEDGTGDRNFSDNITSTDTGPFPFSWRTYGNTLEMTFNLDDVVKYKYSIDGRYMHLDRYVYYRISVDTSKSYLDIFYEYLDVADEIGPKLAKKREQLKESDL